MEKFNIVDTWKLWQRSQEEIVQSEKEMTQFMKSLYDMRIKLQEDRQMYLQALSGSSLQQLELQSKANIVLLKINRLANTLENAISSFRRDSSLSVIIDACADLENDKESLIQYNELEEEDDESDYESSSVDEDD
jgi:LytS/YehU family sensor histidine kinase